MISDGVSASYSAGSEVGYAIGYKIGYALGYMIGPFLYLLIPVVILLIARRNMKGWDQPLAYVWFSFSGRLNRKAYWLKGFVLLLMVNFGVQQAFALVMTLVTMLTGGSTVVAIVIMVFTILPLFVFQIWIGLAVSVKRAHDLGHSGWWLLQGLIPIWNIWVSVQLWFFRGSIGPNRFGEDPIDPYEGSVDEMIDGGNGGGTVGGGTRAHAHPRPPQDGGDEPLKGFGRRASQTAAQTTGAASAPKNDPEPSSSVSSSKSDGHMDIISRRLGSGYRHPVQRKPRD